MKKSVIKLSVFFVVFLAALVIVSMIKNRGHDNLTMEMAPASLPLVAMEKDGEEYNQLHGYYGSTDIAFQRDTVTVLGKEREVGFVVDTFGQEVTGISMEVRSADGSRLIESTDVKWLWSGKEEIRGDIALKDLIEKDVEYSLTIFLELNEDKLAAYYTRVIWSDALYADEKLAFCRNFHEKLYDKEAARELVVYLETDARLEDNASFHKVNIHSSFRQITWGDLAVAEVGEPRLRLTEIAPQTASLLMDFMVSTTEGENTVYYMVQEYYRVRYTGEMMYLLEYERTMTQIPDAELMCANDKILLGIADTDVPMLESEDGNVIVFQAANRLFSYDVATNKLTVIFSFYDEDNTDERTLYPQHAIRILDVVEGGNVQFAVYGYMNRGRHEGEVGIQLYTYNGAQNTVEELLYIPYDKSYAALEAQMRDLLYLNREQKLYLLLNGTVYGIDMVKKTYAPLIESSQDGSLQISHSHKIAMWPEGGDLYHSNELKIRNFATDASHTISAAKGEAIRPLGFIAEDIIYGVARVGDVVEDNAGRIFFPMYKVCISNASGQLLKEYKQEGVYVTGCSVEDNQITLERVGRLESGEYQEMPPDHIMNNQDADSGENKVVWADIDKYERYVEIQLRKTIDSKTLMILTPKEVVYEGGRRLQLPEDGSSRYYVYGPYGIDGILTSPANAVQLAYSVSGVVVGEGGNRIWQRGNRAAKNQIMAIKEASATEERSALAVCLDALLAYEGITRNSQYLLDGGEHVLEILEENLGDVMVLDLSGCSLDAVLYYVNKDIPVLTLLENGSALLLVAFNETQVGMLDPQEGSIRRMNMGEAAEWFEENGNRFVTYHRR